MTEPQPLNYDQPPTLPEEVRQEIEGYIDAINTNPDLGTMFQKHFYQYKRGQIVSPGGVEDKMWRAYCEGVNQGIRSAVTAMVLAQHECESQEEGGTHHGVS